MEAAPSQSIKNNVISNTSKSYLDLIHAFTSYLFTEITQTLFYACKPPYFIKRLASHGVTWPASNSYKYCQKEFTWQKKYHRYHYKKIAIPVISQKISISTFVRVKKMDSATAGLLKAVSAACKNPLPNL